MACLGVTARPRTVAAGQGRRILVHLASGIGNIVLATPLLQILGRGGDTIDLLVEGDYGETAQLFRHWGVLRAVHAEGVQDRLSQAYDVLVPAVPPFYWHRYAAEYARHGNTLGRPPDTLFYRNEQAFYLAFARLLGCRVETAPPCFLPIAPDEANGVGPATLVLAPGCKSGEMAAKRWPYFPDLAALFDDVVVVGTPDDLLRHDGSAMGFPGHVRSFVGRASLAETAGILAAAGAVVANDSGLGHVAAAVGAPTILLFGPTPHKTLGPMPPNVTVLRAGLGCEPCWFSRKLAPCAGRVDCLSRLAVERVAAVAGQLLEAG